MGMDARIRAGDPAAGAIGQRDSPVEREAEFQRHMRPPARLAQHKARHGARSFLRQQPHFDHDAAFAQPGRALPVGARIRIAQRDHYPRHPGTRHQVGTARPARRQMETGFQRHIGRRSTGLLHRLPQRLRFGMRAATLLRPATPDDMAVLDDQAADIGIGSRKPAPARRQRDGSGHETPVGGGRRRLAQGLATSGCAPGLLSASAFTSRWSSMALICLTASLRRAVLRASSLRQSMPNASAIFCIST